MNSFTQVVLLDEASQLSEPVSLLPVARFGCHKLLLLGDPKVLYTTHDNKIYIYIYIDIYIIYISYIVIYQFQVLL